MKSYSQVKAIKAKQSLSPKLLKRSIDQERARNNCDKNGHCYIPHPTMKGIRYCKNCSKPERN